MFKYNPKEKQLNIVLIGNFNPRIFQPKWFADNEIISEADLNYILEEDMLIHKQFAQFKSSWFRFEATETRLQLISTQEAYFEMILDLLVTTFTLLHHTPIHFLGINLDVQQTLQDDKHVQQFDEKYFPNSGFRELDKDVQLFATKLSFNEEKFKVGTLCNFELNKLNNKNDYLLHINQHFELGPSSNGKEFVTILSKNGRKAVKTNNDILKLIIES